MVTIWLFATGAWLTGLVMIVTVAEFEVSVPSLAVKAKLSVPLNPDQAYRSPQVESPITYHEWAR